METRLPLQLANDVRRERDVRRRGAALPAGSLGFSLKRTVRTLSDPMGLLLEHYERYGPVFTIRTLHEPVVWVLGARATHQVLVTDADAFSWREGRFRDLWPLLGDGLLNVDGAHHRGYRKLLLPAFHRESVVALTSTILEEAVAAADTLRPGDTVDLYAWTRDVAIRIALRALVGLELDRRAEHELAQAFETALSLHGEPFHLQLARGPGTPYARAQKARRVLDACIGAEIARRRAAGDPGPGILGMLLGATDEAGRPLPDAAVRDQVVTILFAGHDTTTATLTFLLYEIGRAPAARAALEAELDELVPSGVPTPEQLDGTALPVLERTLMETLRRWPPAWVGPRLSVRDVELDGVHVPAGLDVHYSSWVTHHLPGLWPDPLAFDPDRFLPAAYAALPKGAYIPFGIGSRTCLGKRFGETELRALTAVLCSRLRFAPDPGERLQVITTPTLGPKGGLRFRLRRR